jgi:hypothetical protein
MPVQSKLRQHIRLDVSRPKFGTQPIHYPVQVFEHEPGGLASQDERQAQRSEIDLEDDRQQPHVYDVFMDSTSVFDIDPDTPRDIDELAREYLHELY